MSETVLENEKRYRKKVIDGLKSVDKKLGEVKQDIISWGDSLEKQYEKENKDVHKIHSDMVRMGMEDGLTENQTDYFRRVLPDRYKQPVYSPNPERNSSPEIDHLDYTDIQPAPVGQAYFNTLKDAAEILKKPQEDYLTREQIAELRDVADDITHEVSSICKAHDIATIETKTFDEFDDNEETANKHKDKISQEQSPKSEYEKLQSLLGEEVYKLRDNYDRIGEGITSDNYVTNNKVLLEQLILKFNAINSLHRPLVDRKWQRDWWEWCNILEDYHDQGGTYASSKSTVEVADIKDKNGKPEKRKITKEQIDATHDEYLNEMRFIVTNLGVGDKFGREGPNTLNTLDKVGSDNSVIKKYMFTHEQLKPLDDGFNPTVRSIIDEMKKVIVLHRTEIDDLFQNYQDNERGYRAKRAYYMHDKLSDKA